MKTAEIKTIPLLNGLTLSYAKSLFHTELTHVIGDLRWEIPGENF